MSKLVLFVCLSILATAVQFRGFKHGELQAMKMKKQFKIKHVEGNSPENDWTNVMMVFAIDIAILLIGLVLLKAVFKYVNNRAEVKETLVQII